MANRKLPAQLCPHPSTPPPTFLPTQSPGPSLPHSSRRASLHRATCSGRQGLETAELRVEPAEGDWGRGGGGQRGEGVPAALGTRCCARTVRWYSFSTQSCSTHSPGELPGRETIPFHRLFELNNLVLGTYRGEVPPVENRGKGKLQHEAEASSPLCGGCCE